MVRISRPSLCLVRTESPVFETNSFGQAFKFFGFHWGSKLGRVNLGDKRTLTRVVLSEA